MAAHVELRPGKAKPLFGRHPWLFEGAIARIFGDPKPGDPVEVVAAGGEFVAHGIYNPNSRIRVRLYSWKQSEPVDETLIIRRIEDAIAFRNGPLQLSSPKGGCRLVFSESDGLSGLIIDRFADVVVIQFNALAMLRFEQVICETLNRVVRPIAIARRVEQAIGDLEGISVGDAWVGGSSPVSCVAFEESGVLFHVDPMGGQKTGAFLDQRENRLAVAKYARDQHVLDVFCHAGGFGLIATSQGARSSLGVDSSAQAIQSAQLNAAGCGTIAEFRQGDASAVMSELARAGRTFGVVTCDPPKFARKAADLPGAIRGYEYINRLAIALVEPGGVLATCSCSGHVQLSSFLSILTNASRKCQRELRVLEIRGQAPDHPISLFCPETNYLKCVIARVMD